LFCDYVQVWVFIADVSDRINRDEENEIVVSQWKALTLPTTLRSTDESIRRFEKLQNYTHCMMLFMAARARLSSFFLIRRTFRGGDTHSSEWFPLEGAGLFGD